MDTCRLPSPEKSTAPPPSTLLTDPTRLHVTFVDKEGERHEFEVAKGDNLLDIAQANDLEMEGACGGSCACSTCHIIVEDEEMYNRLPEPSESEEDMLDLAQVFLFVYLGVRLTEEQIRDHRNVEIGMSGGNGQSMGWVDGEVA